MTNNPTHLLAGSVAVVTGSGRGIGREIARELARRGAKVGLFARTTEQIDETAATIQEEGGQALAVTVDLVNHGDVEQALSRVVDALGPIELLVNNHGSFRAFGPIWECDPDTWWDDVAINLQGSFNTARVVAPAMLARGHGRIVNLVGGGTGTSFPHGSGYAASKAGIMRFTECLNDTTVEGGVRAFALDPGLVRTHMTELQLNSPEGKTYLPQIEKLFENGVNVPPTQAAEMVAAIAEGHLDKLAGRMLRAVDDLQTLENETDTILREDKRALRVTGMI